MKFSASISDENEKHIFSFLFILSEYYTACPCMLHHVSYATSTVSKRDYDNSKFGVVLIYIYSSSVLSVSAMIYILEQMFPRTSVFQFMVNCCFINFIARNNSETLFLVTDNTHMIRCFFNHLV